MLRYAWTTFAVTGKDWDLLNENIREEQIQDWAELHPHVIFFFVKLTTDIG